MRTSLALVALALVVGGCGGSGDAREERQPPPPRQAVDRTEAAERMLEDALAGRPLGPPRVPQGFRLRHVQDENVAVAFPQGWQTLSQRDAAFPGVIPTLTRARPGLAPYLRGLAADSQLKLFAFDGRSPRRYPTTAQLVVDEIAAGTTFEQWSRAALDLVRGSSTLRGDVAALRVRLSAGETLRLTYERVARIRGRPLRVGVRQYVIVRRGRLYALTYLTLAESAGRYGAVFDASAATLRLPD